MNITLPNTDNPVEYIEQNSITKEETTDSSNPLLGGEVNLPFGDSSSHLKDVSLEDATLSTSSEVLNKYFNTSNLTSAGQSIEGISANEYLGSISEMDMATYVEEGPPGVSQTSVGNVFDVIASGVDYSMEHTGSFFSLIIMFLLVTSVAKKILKTTIGAVLLGIVGILLFSVLFISFTNGV